MQFPVVRMRRRAVGSIRRAACTAFQLVGGKHLQRTEKTAADFGGATAGSYDLKVKERLQQLRGGPSAPCSSAQAVHCVLACPPARLSCSFECGERLIMPGVSVARPRPCEIIFMRRAQ
jgi:hypothetical protein